MPTRSTKAEDILRVAERLARLYGYNGFSFRDIATAIGIKSASVHYHFPTKEDLAMALVERYAENFFERLGEPDAPGEMPAALLRRFVGTFRQYLTGDEGMCLCGVFAAEQAALPAPVAAAVNEFYARSRNWLALVLERGTPTFVPEAERRRQALTMVAALEGALLTARALGDITAFDDIIRTLQRQAPLAPA